MSGPAGFSTEALHAALIRLPRLADLAPAALEPRSYGVPTEVRCLK